MTQQQFHYITHNSGTNSKKPDDAIPFLLKACEELGVKFVVHDSENTPLTEVKSAPGDMVYRAATTSRGRTIERMLISPEVAHLYNNWSQVSFSRGASYFTHRHLGLPVIATYPTIPLTKEEVEVCLQEVGPFPVIIKARGGTHGVGIIRADSRESFNTICDYLKASNANVFIRKYIPHDYYVRAIVIGDRVFVAHASHIVDGDFRTNADHITDQKRRTYTPTPEMEKMIVTAVRSLGLSFGGVDLLIDNNGDPHIAEVNFPCDFFVTQNVTGVNISGEIVRFLKERANKYLPTKETE